jgi:hypothetical protein
MLARAETVGMLVFDISLFTHDQSGTDLSPKE